MNLVNYDPFRLNVSRRPRSLQDWLLSDFGACDAGSCEQWSPAVDIREEENQFVVTADVPGVLPKDIDVTIDNGVLTIKGHRVEEKTEEKNNYRRVERRSGSFSRSFAFPETVDAEGVKAAGKDGVLEIVIPKKESAVPRKIEVR